MSSSSFTTNFFKEINFIKNQIYTENEVFI